MTQLETPFLSIECRSIADIIDKGYRGAMTVTPTGVTDAADSKEEA